MKILLLAIFVCAALPKADRNRNSWAVYALQHQAQGVQVKNVALTYCTVQSNNTQLIFSALPHAPLFLIPDILSRPTYTEVLSVQDSHATIFYGQIEA